MGRPIVSIKQHRKRLDKLVHQYEVARACVRSEKKELEERTERLAAAGKAQAILQMAAQQVQQQAHTAIAEVVSRCLEAVFDEPYEFRITFERKRGKTDAVLTFVREGLELDPMTASGGGVVDVAAFALRLACLLLSRPAGRRLLVLDEPFRFVSSEYRPRVRNMLEMLAREMDMQFVLVTHITELETGVILRLEE